MWILRILVGVLGMISTHSLFTKWMLEDVDDQQGQHFDEPTMDVHTFYSPSGVGEFQKAGFHSQDIYPGSVMEGYLNPGFSHSQDILASVSNPILRRTVSSASRSRPQTRLSYMSYMNRPKRQGTVNEFDTSKFVNHFCPQPEIGSFGLDLDAPIFVTEPYGRGGLYPDASGPMRRRYSRSNKESNIQWYKPRSLTNLDDDNSSLWSGQDDHRIAYKRRTQVSQ